MSILKKRVALIYPNQRGHEYCMGFKSNTKKQEMQLGLRN
jgi:hypothetical protein